MAAAGFVLSGSRGGVYHATADDRQRAIRPATRTGSAGHWDRYATQVPGRIDKLVQALEEHQLTTDSQLERVEQAAAVACTTVEKLDRELAESIWAVRHGDEERGLRITVIESGLREVAAGLSAESEERRARSEAAAAASERATADLATELRAVVGEGARSAKRRDAILMLLVVLAVLAVAADVAGWLAPFWSG